MQLDRDSLMATSSLLLGATVDDILALGDYQYLATSDATKAFQIISNGESLISSALPDRAVAISCDAKALYVATQNSQDFLHIFSLP